jgi:putative ABC transport system permease protein
MMNDLRYAIRTLLKARAFTLVAVAVLALGIGLNSALYSIVHSVFFRPLPVPDSERLVYLYWMFGRYQQIGPMPFRDFEFFRDHDERFADLTAHWASVQRFTADGETDLIRDESVLSNYFDVLGVKPLLGRTFRPEEDSPGSTDGAMVISHSLWTRRFKRDPAVLGKQVRLFNWTDERRYTIVGVMPEGFKGVSGPWTPTQFWVTFGQSRVDPRRSSVNVIGRLAPGVTVAQAQSIVGTQGEQLKTLTRHRENTRYLAFAANRVRIPSDPMASVVPARLAATMIVVVGIVLLIAAANTAGMLAARGIGRTSELAIRLVLGAKGRRLLRQLLTESILLSIGGGILGLVLARVLLELYRIYTPQQYAVDVAMDLRVLVFTAGLCLAVGVLIGVAPAVRAMRTNLVSALSGNNGALTRPAPARLRYWVVIPQVGLSLVLLLAAGFHVRSLMRIELADVGYDARNVAVVSGGLRPIPGERAEKQVPPGLAEKRAERSRAFYRQVLAAASGVPGTDGVAMASSLPLNAPDQSAWNAVSYDAYAAGDAEGVPASRSMISPGYFQTLRMSILEGRDFDDRDSRTSLKVAIVSEGLARRLWPGQSAIGRSIGAKNNFPAAGEKIEWREVIGLVNDVDPIIRERARGVHVYLPLGQEWQPAGSLVVARVPPDRPSVIQDIKQAVLGADSLAEVYRVQTMEQMIAAILYPRRLAAAILGASGVIGMSLAVLGLYGVISYSVAQRVQEIGIRTALGADRRDVEMLVLREGLTILTVGTGLGLMLTYAALRVTARFVTLPQLDAGTWVMVPLVLAVAILLACYVPARRAARLDPMAALRQL